VAERTLRFAVDLALKELDAGKLDAAGVALARRYASDIDEARVLSVAADKLLRECRAWLEPATYDRLTAQVARIEETTVLALLGPKLVQVLAELGLTPRARADSTRKGGGAGEPPGNELARWRAERNKGLNTS
jgi:hypothetical protein